MMTIIIIFSGISLAFASPVLVKEKFGIRWLVALIASFAGIVVPLLVFLVSALAQPDWKGDCVHGWVDCFAWGKLALLPVAIFATAALYAVEVLQVKNRTRTWIVLSMLQGALLATVCCVYSLTCLGGVNWAQLIPGYIAAWYLIRAGQLIRESQISFKACLFSVLGSLLPFWGMSFFWSRQIYASLPDTSPSGCFIVTAASYGHEPLVGPFVEITRNGRRLCANQQLLTFWEFEARWQARAPGTHALFRQVYNRIGPVIAARIKSPWMADATCLALKPMEFAARWINHNHKE